MRLITAAIHASAVTVSGLLRAAERSLNSGESPRLDAEVLLAHILRCSRAALFRDRDDPVTAQAAQRFEDVIAARARGVPVAYLLGRREFWSLELEVTRDTLIPRPESELLVECALALIPRRSGVRVADLGTGSGAVALAIARERPDATVVATDASEEALAVARRNGQCTALGNVEFRAGDWLVPLGRGRFEVIVSNPPYLAIDDPHLSMGDLRYEPASALVSGGDGLAAIRSIVTGSRVCLTDDGWLLLEHGAAQGAAVRGLLEDAGYVNVQTHRDLADNERVSLGKWPGAHG